MNTANRELKNVLYIGHIGCKGTAMAVHTRNIAQILEANGCQVSFICQCVPRGNIGYNANDRYNYSYTQQYIKAPKISAIEWMIEELSGIKLFKLFKQKAKIQKPNLVIFYGYSGERKFIDYCKKHNIKIIIDRADWFDAADKKGLFGKIHTKYLSNQCIEKYDFKADGVISISEFFLDFYMSRHQKTIWIPPIFSIEEPNQTTKTDKNVIELVYAGSLGNNKDTIDPIIKIFLNNQKQFKDKIILNLVGISKEKLTIQFGKHLWKEYGIFAYGRVTHEEAQRIVAKSDFSILLRENKRYAKAGFSTKFAESMSLGVPVICTKVGGADIVITDMKDGVHLLNNEPNTIQIKLDQLLDMSKDEIAKMKRNAYNTACEKFSMDKHETAIMNFLNSIIS